MKQLSAGTGKGFFFALCFCALFLVSIPVEAQTITDIEITGLKRTKPHIARYPLEQFIGRDGAELDLKEVEAAVKDTGILEPLSVELAETGDGLVLKVEVDEKWSILPMPLVTAGSGGASFGLFLADTNAFGLRDQAAIGGLYGSNGWMAITMYNHTPDRKGPPGWTAAFMYNRQENENTDRDENVYRRYTADTLQGSLGIYYPFTRHITGSAGISYTGISLKDNTDELNAPGDGARLLGFSSGASLRYSDWDGFLLAEQSLSLNYTFYLALSGSSYHALEFQGRYGKSLVPGFHVNLQGSAVWKPEAEELFEGGPGQVQGDILPRSFSARDYAAFSAGLEKYLVKTRYGTLSALAAWQGVFSWGTISGSEFDNGPTGGIRFYLSRLAIPALGAGLAYNINSGLFQFTFNAGMSF
jgi:hypothetical protein